MFMSFFGNLKDLLGLNKSKKDERDKLNKLAGEINNFSEIIFSNLNFKKQLEHAKEYLKISKKLYEVIREIANRRKNSKLAKTIKEAKILDFKSTNNLKQDVEKTEIWLKNFKKVNGGYNSVWDDNIASAIQKLSKNKKKKIFDFIKRNIPQVSGKICNILKKSMNISINKQSKRIFKN